MSCRTTLLTILLFVVARQPSAIADDAPLHAEIDAALASGSAGVVAAPASDAEVLRRVSLDLIGVPPTADEVRAYAADPSPDKYTAAVDRLLADPRYARHQAEAFDVMFMERRGNPHIPQEEWLAYLLQSFRQNKPYNQLAREILAADGTPERIRPAAHFYLARGSEPNRIARDVGRVFFGVDLQCAQCHDHPLVDDYHQSDYHGLLAYFAPGQELKVKEGDKDVVYYAELAGSDVKFESVFISGVQHLTRPRLPGDAQLVEPVFLPGEEYVVKPAANVRHVPRFSRRTQLAEAAASGTNRRFNENIANRLWAQMMGRGLVQPVDFCHSANPATNPALLKLLGERFAAMGFDVRAFLREIAFSAAYRRSMDLPADVLAKAAEAPALVGQLEQEQAALELQSDTSISAYETATNAWHEAEQALLPAVVEMEQARTAYAEALKKVEEAQAALNQAQAQLNAKRTTAQSVAAAAEQAQAALAKVGDDAELAAATQKFVDRSTALAAEVEALQQAVNEKTAALEAPTAALNAARPVLEAAQQTVDPLRSAVRVAERLMLAARETMMTDYAALYRHEERLAEARFLAGIKPLEDTAVASAAVVATRQTELAAAQQQVTDYATVVTEHQTALQTAQANKVKTAEALTTIQAEHVEKTRIAETVVAAVTSAQAASAALPEDQVLKDAATSLKTRSDELAAELVEHQKQVDAAAATDVAAASAITQAQQALEGVQAEMAKRQQAVAAAQGVLAEAQTQAAADRAAVDQALAELSERASEDFAVATLQPLTPEQLCWSILTVTGVYDRTRNAAVTELDQNSPLSDEAKQDPAQVAARQLQIEQATYDKLKGNIGTFVTMYGNAAGQPQTDFFATADQALFAANAGTINGWIAPASGNVTERVQNAENAAAAAEELYLGVLSRTPTEQETADVTTYLAERTEDRAAAARELVWSLITSAEFRFNH